MRGNDNKKKTIDEEEEGVAPSEEVLEEVLDEDADEEEPVETLLLDDEKAWE